jgi:hypothetical protein
MHYQARESRTCLNCPEDESSALLPEQITEMEGIARIRLVKAKKVHHRLETIDKNFRSVFLPMKLSFCFPYLF